MLDEVIQGAANSMHAGLIRKAAGIGFGMLLLIAQSDIARSESGASLRRKARVEVERLFLKKQIEIEAGLVSADGPEFWEKLFGKKVFGCPPEPVTQAAPTYSLAFTSGKAGSWAGALDGINTRIAKSTGATGMGFAVPSNSTARAPADQGTAQLEFTFDGTQDVKRSMIDTAIEQIDQCLSALPPGSYSGDQLSQLCPAPSISRSQQGQTCVLIVSGAIGEKLDDGSGHKVYVNQQTMCDFVGYDRSRDTSTVFWPCFLNRYEGVAKIRSGRPSEKVRALRASAGAAMKKCGRTKRRRNAGRINQCVWRTMTRAM